MAGVNSSALHHALTDADPLGLRPLPERAADLVRDLGAPPRLGAHLRAVHDVACQLVDWVRVHHGGVRFDGDAVCFGAATHDIGKIRFPNELSGPGAAHEAAGFELLCGSGVPERLARFARTHASWDGDGAGFEDLLVSLADKVWKGKRVTELEQLVIEQLAAAADAEHWEVFLALDGELERLAADADRRLEFQASYPL